MKTLLLVSFVLVASLGLVSCSESEYLCNSVLDSARVSPEKWTYSGVYGGSAQYKVDEVTEISVRSDNCVYVMVRGKDVLVGAGRANIKREVFKNCPNASEMLADDPDALFAHVRSIVNSNTLVARAKSSAVEVEVPEKDNQVQSDK